MSHLHVLRSDKFCKLCALFLTQGQKKLSPKKITLFAWYISGLYSPKTSSKLSFLWLYLWGRQTADSKSLCLRYKRLTSLVTTAKLWSLRGSRLPATQPRNPRLSSRNILFLISWAVCLLTPHVVGLSVAIELNKEFECTCESSTEIACCCFHLQMGGGC